MAEKPLSKQSMSEQSTPRTDANLVNDSELFDEGWKDSPYVRADFARELERELAEAKRDLDKAYRLAGERNKEWAKCGLELAEARKDNAAMKKRIK